MTTRRVGLTPTSRSTRLGVGMDRSRDQPECGRRRIAGHQLVARLHDGSSLDLDHVRAAGLAIVRTSTEPRARSMRSVWSRVATDSRTVVVPSARSPASRIADLTCADGTGVDQSIGRERARPADRQGWQRLSPPAVDRSAHRRAAAR